MSGCPSVHEHPEFQKSHDSNNKNQNPEIPKLKIFFKADPGHAVWESLLKEALDPRCSFCGSQDHHMDDGVLFYVADHDKDYKQGKQIAENYLS